MKDKEPTQKLEEILERLEALKAEVEAVKADIPGMVIAQKLDSLNNFISGMSHEFNNPLTSILGYAQIILGDLNLPPDKIREYAQLIYKGAQRCEELTRALLASANRTSSWKTEYLDLNQVLESNIKLIEKTYQENGLTIERDYGQLPETEVNRGSISQVFINILRNGLDEMSQLKEGTMHVRTYQERDRIYVIFSDTGRGLKEPLKVFDPFYTTREVGKGTGLGLSVCYQTMKLHEANILACNYDEGSRKGARFILEFPIVEKKDETPAEESGSEIA
ncbi:MAG: HAMP domain-containing histidine kinase [Nanoarchaeota archaeon]|nr:HAMP domain-containing histidine kinase [Nanoarchaeota archaeon]